jgi:hypothetical protein
VIEAVPSSTNKVDIDFLYSEDCPSHERALDLLKQIIRDEDVQARIHVRRVDSEEEAQELAFPGSPTIRVDGKDIEETTDTPIGLTCRAYMQDNGRISPLPPRDRIISALRNAV